ncbi:hypothetical protein E2562_006341 [Oryza meyeriana var. granulata]|uniref:Knottins-like domain-containing protein n=1 Tax=Oryza meyeriana var. granulata TaxID=110450 RepID=A0A6G1EHK8_9ORYZ|nr:hypothetical protein E2562_006341 [Oryza meyeriana var. granulata]
MSSARRKTTTVLAIALLMAILLASFSGTEADICKAKSKLYRGTGRGNRNCAMICTHENYTGGYCSKGFFSKCMCTKRYGGLPPPSGEGGGGGDDPPSSEARVNRSPPLEPK